MLLGPYSISSVDPYVTGTSRGGYILGGGCGGDKDEES